MSDLNLTQAEINFLLSPAAIRKSALQIFDYAEQGQSFFKIDHQKLTPLIEYVLKVIRKNYPDLNIPFHSRWGHFRAGKIDRALLLEQKLSTVDAKEKARVKLDLVITSVLLDAGAGLEWSYHEKDSGQIFSRSEGLGVASFHLFMSGLMSSDQKTLRADHTGLKKLSRANLENYFQVSATNPLLGVEGRLQLLNNLAKALENKTIFKDSRPGNILDYLIEQNGETLPARAILRAVLDGLGPIWPGRLHSGQTQLGDIWRHSKLDALIAFHKLSQWMTYSLIEPIEEAGIKVTGVEELTGLAEYRNGGLMIDSGLLIVKDPANLEKRWSSDSDFIIEWRALTVYFLDIIGAEVQKALGKNPQEFPLAKVLEGGTWWAGRFIAKEKRPSGEPPVQIQSDGTVF
jgi:hypothetical protein